MRVIEPTHSAFSIGVVMYLRGIVIEPNDLAKYWLKYLSLLLFPFYQTSISVAETHEIL